MAKRVLMVAAVAATIGSFNMENIRMLQELGYSVDVATNFTDTSVWTRERLDMFRDQLNDLDVEEIQIDFSRSPLKVRRHISSYNEVLKLLRKKQYSFIHTHTPIASAVIRIAAHKTGTKVIYTAHGFHFYDGAPLRNWLMYYPVEKMLSRWTDVLITINKEDYKRAKEKFQAKRTEYIPGVGVDTEKFKPRESGRDRIRSELELSNKQVMLLSVGELNENKNHEAVIKAIQGLDITYVIVGKGELEDKLENVATECGVDLRLMGFRNDVADFYDAADIYILPSIREGLNVSLMEAMAASLPCLCGKIRGNRDLIDDEECFFDPKSVEEQRAAIKKIIKADREKRGVHNLQKIRKFDLKSVESLISEIYRGVSTSDRSV